MGQKELREQPQLIKAAIASASDSKFGLLPASVVRTLLVVIAV